MTTWPAFIRTHLALLAGTDFFVAEVLTLRGLVTYYVLFFIHLESRRVDIAPDAFHSGRIAVRCINDLKICDVKIMSCRGGSDLADRSDEDRLDDPRSFTFAVGVVEIDTSYRTAIGKVGSPATPNPRPESSSQQRTPF